jgi:hypothetical protein
VRLQPSPPDLASQPLETTIECGGGAAVTGAGGGSRPVLGKAQVGDAAVSNPGKECATGLAGIAGIAADRYGEITTCLLC